MPNIKILPVNLRNKIAAGEVIERPASVVKELIENSIDAHATEITIDILYGGKRLIRVSDNGIGMDREDALLCFERYATSKLTNEDDLSNIKTMGFRGEALSSIAAVSKLKIITGLRDNPIGVSIELHEGNIKEIKDSPSSGTIVEVRDLFYNTPARKKFLKSNATELYHIIDIITKEAISHWWIGFRLNSDKQETINLPKASGPKERIMQVYGDEFLKGLTEVNIPLTFLNKNVDKQMLSNGWDKENIKMTAFVSKSNNFRNMKSHQFIYINNRPIKDLSITHAVYNAYEGIIPRNKHPVFFIFLYMNPQNVDFNVHPAKREVKFENKDIVYNFVSSSLKRAIKEERRQYTKSFVEQPSDNYSTAPYSTYKSSITSTEEYFESKISESLEIPYRYHLPYIYIGETFIAISGKGGLTLIDYHAAHERILYEKFLKGMGLNSCRLLFPKQIILPHKEYMVILENKSILGDFGIDVDDFGHNTLIVRSLPDVLKNADIGSILSDIASCIIEDISPNKSLKESLAARIACHGSIRGKDILSQEEVSQLLADLEQTEHPDQCPHGRPTRIFFSTDDLKKMFKRK